MTERTDHRAAGESAGAVTPGMECGHAAQQGVGPSTFSSSSDGAPTPAGAAVFEHCARRLEPDFTKSCPNHATGGLRITLKPAPAVTKRWGTHSLLTFVMDLPLCQTCFPKVKIHEVIDEKLRSNLGKAAQRMNNGVLVDWSQSVIEHVPFTDREYVVLRTQMTKQAAQPDTRRGHE